ncbi:MAG: hypothetical protein J5I41_12550, partial [Saprospiraceae bacterium]|nr:hypothetical protein [Saprospiraceae bacterium]
MRTPMSLTWAIALLGYLSPVVLNAAPSSAINGHPAEASTCDNATNGGLIEGDETGCPDPVFDPSPIVNVLLPSGGSGNLEYMWIFTSDDPGLPVSMWTPIPGSDAPDYDPGPITETTWYRRCARREGCTDYVAESNIVVKEVNCCVNFTDGGEIGIPQIHCGPFDPDTLISVEDPSGGNGNPVYFWYQSTVSGIFNPQSWTRIQGASGLAYDPDSISQTTWLIRFAQRELCPDSLASNIIQLTVLPPPAITGEVQHPSCPGVNDGSVLISVTGGTPPYQYLWSNGAQTPFIDQLGPGVYSVSVTDSLDCSSISEFILQAADSMDIEGQLTHPGCPNAQNGMISLSISGGTPGYSILWSTGDTTAMLTGLAAGTYSVSVADAQGCVQSRSYVLTDPTEMQISGTLQDPSCPGEEDGIIQVNVSGGTPGYTYLWNTGDTTANVDSLPAGAYSVTVTDSQGCQAGATFTLQNPETILITGLVNHPNCAGGQDGSIQLTLSGGTSPYTFLWNNAPPVPNPSQLSAGLYTVLVTDANGCTAQMSFELQDPEVIEIDAAVELPDCAGGETGSILLSVTGGTPGYSYLWNTGDTGPVLDNLPAGTYSVTVTDANGCTETASFTLTEPGGIMVMGVVTPVTCYGLNNGSIQTTTTGGTPPYNYLWSNGSTSPNQVNLPGGTYHLSVSDDSGCDFMITFVVTEPGELSLVLDGEDPTCAGDKDGSATVLASGGTVPYQYLWNTVPAQTGSIATGLGAGNWSVTVTDDNGCSATGSVTLTEPSAIQLTLSGDDPDCFGGTDGSATVQASGGTAPYQYLWNTVPAQTGSIATGLGAGNWSVTVTDDNGCTAIGNVTLTQPTAIQLTLSGDDPDCFGGTDGSATVLASGGTAPYQYLWNTVPAQTGSTATGLGAGNWSVTVTDDNGCAATGSVTLTQPTAIQLTLSGDDPDCFGGTDGSATVLVSGGTAPYQYLWNTVPAQTGSFATGLGAGNWSVSVTDDNGCTATGSVTLTQPTAIQLTLSGDDPDCFGGTDGSATVMAMGGMAPYQYLWNTVPAQTGSTATGLGAGTWSVTVTDDNGCTATGSVGLVQPADILLQIETTDQTCIPKSDGQAEVIATGGNPPYSFQWDDPGQSTTSIITGLAPGTYKVTVTDSDGCSKVAEAIIEASVIPCDCQVRIGDYVWYDFNRNGIQNTNEQGINGIPVDLVQAGPDLAYGTDDDDIIQSTVTSGFGFQTGRYLFEDVCAGTYSVCFRIDTISHTFSPPFQGGDKALDSDALIATGCTPAFTVTSQSGDDLTQDAGIHDRCVEVTDPGEIGYDQTLCYPGEVPNMIISVQDPEGGVDPLEYMWLVSDVAPVYWVGNADWKEIPGAIGPEYQPGPVQKTTY